MRKAFKDAELPAFERVPGVEVKEELLGSGIYPVPRLTPYLKVVITDIHTHTDTHIYKHTHHTRKPARAHPHPHIHTSNRTNTHKHTCNWSSVTKHLLLAPD